MTIFVILLCSYNSEFKLTSRLVNGYISLSIRIRLKPRLAKYRAYILPTVVEAPYITAVKTVSPLREAQNLLEFPNDLKQFDVVRNKHDILREII